VASLFDPSDPAHDRARDRLGKEPIVWLTTVRDDGQPQTTPVWFLWQEGRILMYSRPGKPKLRNVARNASVSLHLEGDGVGGDVVVLEGRAEVDEDGPPADRVPEYVDKYRDLIRDDGWTPESFAADYAVPVRITPTVVRAW
jgi:PPOX class probable F420-dependent enzyme